MTPWFTLFQNPTPGRSTFNLRHALTTDMSVHFNSFDISIIGLDQTRNSSSSLLSLTLVNVSFFNCKPSFFVLGTESIST